MSTTCSECGLAFEMRLVLNARLRDKARFFEVSRYHPAHSLVTTTALAVRPWKFWRWVVLEYPPRVGRMVVGAIGAALVVESASLAVAAILVAIPWCVDRLKGASRWYVIWPLRGGVDRWLEFLTPWMPDWGDQGVVKSFLILALLNQAVMPFTFFLLPQTLRRAKVRRVHLLRIGVWSLVGAPLAVGAVQFLHLVMDLLTWLCGLVMPRSSPYTYSPAEEFLSDLSGLLRDHQDVLLLAAIGGWTFVWWGCAAGRYLKLERPWLVTLVMGAIAFLGSLVAGIFLPGLWYAIGLRF
jgi:hypothetical protein